MSTVQMVRTDAIRSVRNPRKTLGDVTELAASIRQHGVLQPVGLRLMNDPLRLMDGPDTEPTNLGFFELVFGQRRLAAARLAGLTEIPAVVREMTDAEADEAALIENLQRADIPPLEEADAFRALLDGTPGLTVDELALRVGKPASAVRLRLALSHLCAEARDAFTAGKFSLGAIQELARVEREEEQRRLTAELLQGWQHGADDDGEPVSRADARRKIFRGARSLALAPFDTTDATLAGPGACTTCPKRTEAQGALFGLTTADDQCTDAQCWGWKVEAHSDRVKAAAAEHGVKVLEGKAAEQVTSYGGYLNHGWKRLTERVEVPFLLPHTTFEPDTSKTDEENEAAEAAFYQARHADDVERRRAWREQQDAQPTYAEKLKELGLLDRVPRVVVTLDGVATEVARKADLDAALGFAKAAAAEDSADALDDRARAASKKIAADAKLQAAVEKRAQELLLQGVLEKCSTAKDVNVALRALVMFQVQYSHPRAEEIAVRCGLLPKEPKPSATASLRAIIAEVEKAKATKDLVLWLVDLSIHSTSNTLVTHMARAFGLKSGEFQKAARKEITEKKKAGPALVKEQKAKPGKKAPVKRKAVRA